MASAATTEPPRIQLGDYIVIQRQKYTKLQKFSSLDTVAVLGKEQLELRGLLDQPYSATFKMCAKEPGDRNAGRGGRGGHMNRLQTLERCSDTELRGLRDVLSISASGDDNRNIVDDGGSQALRPEEIELLREECSDSSKIIEKLVENSKTFSSKTEYSQDKYLKKKEKKYFEYLQIRRPSIRLITEIFYRQDAEKVMGLRVDTLSKLISHSGVSGFGNYMLYESGTNGLLPAVFLNSMGAGTEAQLVHLHPGNVCQRQAIIALNFPEEQTQRCVSVNIYSVLRAYYQGDDDVPPAVAKLSEAAVVAETTAPEAEAEAEEIEPSSKKQKLNDASASNATIAPAPAPAPVPAATVVPHKWQVENRRATAMMREKFDSLVVVAKEHPANIVNALLPFVKPSRPVVVFSLIKEVLTELYAELKTNGSVTNLHLTSNWMRMYQILPNRTHPEVNMNGSSGFLLTGYTVC